MIGLWLALGLAWGQATCEGLEPLRGDRLAVAWVSPLGAHAFGSTWLEVVPAANLRGWLDEEGPRVGRMLQGLGVRRRESDPKRPWKVTVFEVDVADLCRPLLDVEEGQMIDGMLSCPERLGRSHGGRSGCGYTVDRGTGERALDTFRIRWRDAARAGFCVLPAERFVRGT